MVCLNGWHRNVPLRDMSANVISSLSISTSLEEDVLLKSFLTPNEMALINLLLNVMVIELLPIVCSQS